MKSITYIIAWDGAIENCRNISNQLENGNITHKFFNVSSYPELNKNWERKPDLRYYRHFFNAVKDFLETDSDIFIFNAGDAKCVDWAKYTRYIELLFSHNPKLIGFSPNATNDDWSGARSRIAFSKRYENIYLTTCTNGIYFAMSREICEVLNDFYKWSSIENNVIEAEKMISGWGIDILLTLYAVYNEKYCYRDKSLKLEHPPSSSYNRARATEEGHITINAFCLYARDVLGYDWDRFTSTLPKIKQLFNYPESLGIEDFYISPNELED